MGTEIQQKLELQRFIYLPTFQKARGLLHMRKQELSQHYYYTPLKIGEDGWSLPPLLLFVKGNNEVSE